MESSQFHGHQIYLDEFMEEQKTVKVAGWGGGNFEFHIALPLQPKPKANQL